MKDNYIIEMLNIRKEFPSVVANDNITIQLKQGEILALLGENGAGKSTLMSILFGLFHLDKGVIKVKGKKVKITDPNVANKLGIGMVHQHFQLVHNFTATENIILGLEGSQVLKIKDASAKIKTLSHKYGLDINPDIKIENISVGMQQRVEILKMLYRNAEVLIFDEPTAVLTPQEIKELMKIMKTLVKQGKSIILITHKLKEIKQVADRCTVIRRGKVIGTVNVKTSSEASMAEMMVGREVSFKVDKSPSTPGKVILDIKNLSALNNQKTLGLKQFSLQVRAGEIVGLAGVDGNGQTELVESLIGLRKIESGNILLNNIDITSYSIRERIESGLAHIPEDRHKHGLVLEFNVGNNIVINNYYNPPYSKNGLLKPVAIKENAKKVISQFDIRTGALDESLASSLSGGNQQKVIVGREMSSDPDLLIAVQPTRGLDVGAIEYIHKRLIEQRDKGKAVLLISLELDEILDLSDRIAVINNGELIDSVNASDTNENEVGLMMAGVKRGES